MTLQARDGGTDRSQARFGDDRVEKAVEDHSQQAPHAAFYAAARRGEAPRCSAMSGSVNKISSR